MMQGQMTSLRDQLALYVVALGSGNQQTEPS